MVMHWGGQCEVGQVASGRIVVTFIMELGSSTAVHLLQAAASEIAVLKAELSGHRTVNQV